MVAVIWLLMCVAVDSRWLPTYGSRIIVAVILKLSNRTATLAGQKVMQPTNIQFYGRPQVSVYFDCEQMTATIIMF